MAGRFERQVRRIAAVGADEAALDRLTEALGGHMPPVLEEPLDARTAPEVLVVCAGRGTTARNARLQRLRAALPNTRLVVVGPADSPSSVRTALESGADGVCFTEDLERTLGPTVAAVRAGQVAVPASRRLSVGTPSFTTREKQILAMVVEGCSNKEIGARLYLADSTVKSHLSSAFAKLGVRSRNEAVTMILDPHQNLRLGILGPAAPALRDLETV